MEPPKEQEMSERIKYFADKQAQAKAEAERRKRELEEAQTKAQEIDETFTRGADVYFTAFSELADELRGGGLRPEVKRDTTVVTAVDPHTQEKYAGNVYLTLSFTAGGTRYEMVYLCVQRPSVLGMLAWRRDNAPTFYVGQQAKAGPASLNPELAKHHVNVALDAMKLG